MKKGKIYNCIKCEKEITKRIKKMCQFCYYKHLSLNKPKKNYYFKQSDKNKLKKQEKFNTLKPYFDYHLENIKKKLYCENCGCKIKGNISNIAHVLPKRKYGGNPEIMDDINNYLYLCSSFDGIDCHSHYDSRQATSRVYNMLVWKIAVQRYLTFKNKVSYNKYVENFENYIENDSCKNCKCGHDYIDHVTLYYDCSKCDCEEYINE